MVNSDASEGIVPKVNLFSEQEGPTVNIFQTPLSNLSAQTIQDRADRYHYAASIFSPGVREMYAQIQAGNEAGLRGQIARQTSVEKEKTRVQLLDEFVRSKAGQSLTDTEFEFFQGLSQEQMQNPETVFEELQARRTIADLHTANDYRESIYNESSDIANVLDDVAEQTMAKKQLAYKLLEDRQATLSAMDPFSKVFDYSSYILGSSIPFVYQWRLHNIASPPFPTSFLTGNNKAEQYAYLMSLPVEQFWQAIKAIDADLGGGSSALAVDFLSGLVGYSSSDGFLDNAFAVLDVGAAAVVAGKVGVASVKGSLAGRGPALKGGGSIRPSRSDVSLSLDQAINQLYRNSTPEQIAKELNVPVEDVNRIINDLEHSEFAPIPGSGYDATPGLTDVVSLPQPFGNYAETLKQTIKAVDPARPNVAEAAAAAGHSEMAATANFFREMKSRIEGMKDYDAYQSLFSKLGSWMDPAKNFRGAFKLTRAYADDVLEKVEQSSGYLMQTLARNQGVSSLAHPAWLKAVEQSHQVIKDLATRANANDAIIDYDIIFPEESFGNLGIHVVRFGRPDGTMFKSIPEAENFLKKWKLPDTTVKQSGQSYILQMQRPVVETDHGFREFMVDTKNATPRSWLTTALDAVIAGGGKFRTPANTLSEAQRGMRESAIQALTEMGRLVELAAAPIIQLGRGERIKLSRFLDRVRREEDVLPDGTRVKGIEFGDQSEFETAWHTMFQQYPSADASAAYWTSINLNQYEFVLRNLAISHWKARQGARMWQVSPKTEAFEGIKRKSIDWESSEGDILVYLPKGERKLYTKSLVRSGDAKFRKNLDKMLSDDGYELIQVGNPFNMGYDPPVHFVMTKTAQSSNLPYLQLPYRGGGHIKYDYPEFIKQSSLSKGADGTTYHVGDNTVLPVTTRAEATKIVKVLGEAQTLYKAGDFTAFETLLRGATTMDPEIMWNKFANGTLSPDIPFVNVHSGENSLASPTMQTLLGGNFRSWADSELNYLKGMNLEFAGRRGWDPAGVMSLADEDSPIFEMADIRMIDPLSMIQQSIGRAQRNKMLQSYQIRTAEHFVEEFSHIMDLRHTSIEYLRDNPIATLRNPKYLPNADRRELAAARAYQEATLRLVGTSTEWKKWETWMRGRMMDSVYNRLGDKPAEIVYEHLWMVPNPLTLARQVAFHLKLGLFNPTQLFIQYQTFTNVMAVAPARNATAGLFGGILMRMVHAAGRNPMNDLEFVKGWAKYAKPFGWKEDDFVEAYDMMIRSGVFNIGPQHAWRSDVLDPKIFTSKTGKYLDKAAFFFNEGERGNHLAGFATAFHEWRSANRNVKLTREAEQDIMSRYSDLTVNMTHAQSSALNRGIGALGGQFFSYSERLAELLLGHRLTMRQKARALSVYAAMYGVPVAMAGATTIPFYEDFRAWQLEHGQKDNVLGELFMQGLPETILHRLLTGTEIAYANRYGPSGLQIWKDLRNGDLTFWQLGTGASASILRDIWDTAVPLAKSAKMYLTDNQDAAIKVVMNDAIELLKNASAVSNGMRLYYGLALQKYVNKGLVTIDNEVNPIEALLIGIAGIQPTRINDVQIMKDAVKYKAEAQSFARAEAKRYFRLAWSATDRAEAEAFHYMARVWMLSGDLTFEERSRLLSEAITEVETQGSAARRSFSNEFPESIPQPEAP